MNNPMAFPATILTKDQWQEPTVKIKHEGMTLRDYFAGQCIIGWMTAQPDESCHVTPETAPAIIAGAAYKIADAMLKAREQ